MSPENIHNRYISRRTYRSVRGPPNLSPQRGANSLRRCACNLVSRQTWKTYIVSPDLISLRFRCIHSVLSAQVDEWTFQCNFYEVPLPAYRPKGFPKKHFDINDPDVRVRKGTLDANLSHALMRRGAFKTAHPGEIQFQKGTNPFIGGKVCVKQVYESKEDDATRIIRLKGREELEKLSVECNCLRWASILLDLTYQFIDREVKKKGKPPLDIPELRFARTMIAIVRQHSKQKVFLVEEWLDLGVDGDAFQKYLSNRFSKSCVSRTAAPEVQTIAEFLIFAQHVQWEKTGGLAFISDYQGAGNLLTDPQITSNP